MSSATRLPCLDGLRGIAAIGVMLFYFQQIFPAAKPFFRPRCSLVGNPAAKNLRRSFEFENVSPFVIRCAGMARIVILALPKQE